MAKHVTLRERSQAPGWNARFLLDRDRAMRWLRRHPRMKKRLADDRPWWWWMANR